MLFRVVELVSQITVMVSRTALLAFAFSLALQTAAKPTIDQQILQLEKSNDKRLQYPTQFTQGILPKPIHSHNDCEYSWNTTMLRETHGVC